ncbi:MAG: hypothetical protein HY314_15155 [Acidobacteria bacterium]|nr:hypothetical protein [Acidobacteriota bacterium]
MEPTGKTHPRFHRYDVILGLAALALLSVLLPDAVYLNLLTKTRITLDAERAAAMLQQFRLLAAIMAIVALALWWAARKLAPEIQSHFDFKPKFATLLLQLHFFIFIPTIAFWFFYTTYRLTVPEPQWRREQQVVPWHNDLPDAVARLRHQIPEDASVLLILEQPGTISYAAYFNTYLYPRKVYVFRHASNQGRTTRADVNVEQMHDAGIGWIITYSGPREFDIHQLKVERIPY